MNEITEIDKERQIEAEIRTILKDDDVTYQMAWSVIRRIKNDLSRAAEMYLHSSLCKDVLRPNAVKTSVPEFQAQINYEPRIVTEDKP